MKKILLYPMLLIFAGVTAPAQERPHQYVSTDKPQSVRARRVAEPMATKIDATIETERRFSRHYLPSPPFGVSHKQQAALRRQETLVKMPQASPEGDRGLLSQRVYMRPPSLVVNKAARLKGHSTGDLQIDELIVDSSQRYRIDPLLIYAQMSQESGFKRRATSHKGASGLMQLMPATARRLGVTDIYDPRQNIDGGVKYMRILLDLFEGDVDLALAGYNAGEGAVMKYGYQIPPYRETQDYVKRISARYRKISNDSAATQTRRAGPLSGNINSQYQGR